MPPRNFLKKRRFFERHVVVVCLLVAIPASAAAENRIVKNRPLRIRNATTTITKATVSGPVFQATTIFSDFEDLQSSRVKRLRKEYQLDDVVAGEENEFRRILKLRHWVHSRWPIDNSQKFSGDAFAILKKAKSGAGFHCAHSMRVQHAVMTSMGFVARDLAVDVNHEKFGFNRHHGVNEVWSNDYAKWVLLDAKYDHHFERDGVPLSALELHEAVRADGSKGIVKVQGLKRKPVAMKAPEFPANSAASYWWVAYHINQDRFTRPNGESRLVILDNPAFRETTWIRDGSKHWAYAAKAFIPTRERHQIEWTPGVPDLKVRQVSGKKLDVTLNSTTPNLKSYAVRTNRGPWKAISGNQFLWTLKAGENTLDVNTENRFGVKGPVITATVMFQPEKALSTTTKGKP